MLGARFARRALKVVHGAKAALVYAKAVRVPGSSQVWRQPFAFVPSCNSQLGGHGNPVLEYCPPMFLGSASCAAVVGLRAGIGSLLVEDERMDIFSRNWLRVSGICALLFVGVACSDDDSDDSHGCTIVETDAGRLLRCDDGTEALLPDEISNPEAGCSLAVVDGGVEVSCPDGSSVTVPTDTGSSAGQQGSTGLVLTLQEPEVDADGLVSVTVVVADAAGAPLDREAEGIAPRFTFAMLLEDGSGFESHIVEDVASELSGQTTVQATYDSAGTWEATNVAAGEYRYRFNAPLASDVAASRTQRIAVWATRSVGEVTYAADAFLDFTQDGSQVAQHDVTPTETCNQCHNPLAVHGSQRLSVELCVTCHTSQAFDPDTGNTLEFAAMVHKIHMGEQLPSVEAGVPYQIVGYRDSVHDYSQVVFPHEVHRCETCHTGNDGGRWSTAPSQQACGACHDTTDFELAWPDPDPNDDVLPHSGGPRANDSCTTCHAPQPDGQPGLSVEELHQVGRLNPAAPTFEVSILEVRDTGVADQPTVEFQVLVAGAGRDLVAEPLDSLRLVLAGPTTGIVGDRSYTILPEDLMAVDATAGQFAYTLPETLGVAIGQLSPVAATPVGSFGFMIEGRHTFTVPTVVGETEEVRLGFKNPVTYFAVTGDVVARREVVSTEKCNACHFDMHFHGDNRNRVEACVFCHNANLDTTGRMPTPDAGLLAEAVSVRFGPMIHRIHGHEIASETYVLYSYTGGALDFSDLHYPGAASACDACHLEGTADLPIPTTLPPSVVRYKNDQGLAEGVVSEVPATTANCGGCHDSAAAFAHMDLMTTDTGAESCATCHGEGRTSGLDVVHARPEWD